MIDGFWHSLTLVFSLCTFVIDNDVGYQYVSERYLYLKYFCPN